MRQRPVTIERRSQKVGPSAPKALILRHYQGPSHTRLRSVGKLWRGSGSLTYLILIQPRMHIKLYYLYSMHELGSLWVLFSIKDISREDDFFNTINGASLLFVSGAEPVFNFARQICSPGVYAIKLHRYTIQPYFNQLGCSSRKPLLVLNLIF